MGRRASPSPSRGRRTRGAAFQRSGGGGLTEGIQRHQAERHPRKELRDMEAQRPSEKEHGDLGRENRETRAEEVNTRGEDTETVREE